MDELLRGVVEGLERAEPGLEALAELGEPEPAKAASALVEAVRHPDLAPARGDWLPALLLTARPGYGAQVLRELADRYRTARRAPLPIEHCPALAPVVGSSDFLARLLLRHPHWIDSLTGAPPPPPDPAPVEADWTAIRVAKYRGLLRVAGRDLVGRPFHEGLAELSDLADRCLAAALACAARETDLEPPALLALGKLGGRELNFSSDVDLLFLYRAADLDEDLARNEQNTRLIRTLKSHLEAPSEDGFGYRVDLDLRPEGRTGALANSVDAALLYYETFGAEWERQMLIRLRHVAGPEEDSRQFAAGIEPFVYRRAIDPQAIAHVRDMKARIEAERTRDGRDLSIDLKEGPGGIRDVEFLVQALQLLYAGHEPALRGGNVLDALATLERLGLLPDAVTAPLAEAYVWLRRAEHAVQLVEERQLHRLPTDPGSQVACARRMGYREPSGARARDRLLDDWTSVRTEVRRHFEDLVLTSVAP